MALDHLEGQSNIVFRQFLPGSFRFGQVMQGGRLHAVGKRIVLWKLV